MARTLRLAVVALATALAVAACGGGEPAPSGAPEPAASRPQVVDDGTLAAGGRVAAPRGEVVLTVTGAIGAGNNGRRLELDLASLERMRRVRLVAAEPFLKRRILFEGVLLADVLEVAGVLGSASRVSLTARDGYKVDVPLADVRSSRMVLATRADGRPMPVDKAGPIRIVFPDGSSLGRNPGLWIWRVASMEGV